MKRPTFQIAGRTWTARKTGEWINLMDGNGTQINAKPEDIYFISDNQLLMGTATLRDDNRDELKQLHDWIHAEQWPGSSPVATIKQQLEPNHAP